MKKRILAVIMAVCVSMTALPADVSAAEDSAVQTESTQKTSPAEKSAQTENAGNAAEELTGTEMTETEETTETVTIETETIETEEPAETETSETEKPAETETSETEKPAETETIETETTETESTETETAETETEESTETETTETETEEPTETETAETETVQAAELNYMMVESPYVETPGTQNVVLSLGTGDEQLSDIVLNYKNLTTGKAYQTKTAGIEEDMIRFTMDFSENGQAGEYQITSVQFTQEKTKQEILLSDLGMDVRFGVNEQAETNPDQVLYDEDAYADVDADVVTMSADGEVISENTVENVLEQGISDAVASVADNLKGANSNVKVVLDPGHDGTHAGASGFGVQEADLTLKIATYCKEELSTYNGITVYMTRESASCPAGGGDNIACLDARANLAKNVGANVLVSFHLNTANGTARGVEVYYPNSNYNAQVGSNGQALAKKICDKLAALGLNYRGTLIRNASYDKYPDGSAADYYGLIRRCKNNGIPGLIIEHAFLDNANDYYTYLSSDDKLKALGVADATAIAEYFGLTKGAQTVTCTYTQSRADGSLKIKWSGLDNVDYYEIWRDTKDAYDYEKIDEVSDATSFIDDTVELGTRYYYLVRPVFNDGTTGEYSKSISGVALAKTNFTKIEAKSGKKVALTWKKVSQAEGYLIYRKDSEDGKYNQIGKVTSGKTLTYTDTVKSNNKTYTYKIQAYNTNNGKQGVGAYSSTKSAKTLAKAKITGITSSNEEVLKISWNKVSGAKGYIISRSTKKDSGYSEIDTVSGEKTTSYTDDTVKAGKTYYYKVEAYNVNSGTKGYGGASDAVAGKTAKRTKITSIVSTNEKTLTIKWNKITGAYGYRIKRSTDEDGTYKVVKTIKSGNTTSYKDTSVKAGKTYYYTVETMVKTGDNICYSGDSASMEGRTAKKAKIKYAVSNGSNQIEVNWGAVRGAYGYRIKRSTSKNGTYKVVATLKGKNNTTYQDKKLKTAKTYYYKVETINKVNGKKGYSGNSAAVSAKTLKTTSITAVKATGSTSVRLEWKAVDGASGYQIYRSTSKDSGYKKVGQVKGKNTKKYEDKTLEAGKTYYYQVRAYKSNSAKNGVASFSKAQKAWTIKQVVFSQITSDSKNQVTLGWKKVSKAQGYDIYRSDESNSGFEKIASISSGSTLTYTDKGVKSGNTYYYKIAATYKIKGSAGRGSYSKVTEVAVLKQGSISSITLGDNNVLNISWNSVANASGYELAGAVSEKGTYTTLQTSGATSFTHSNLVQGTTYYYKVRAYKDLSNGIRMYGPWSAVKAKAAAHEIMGTSSVTVDQMVSYYNKRYTFPADTYRDKGADSAEAFFKILKEEAEAEGVRADVLFAQVMLETGGLKFGGDVQPSQCNFGGLGAVGGGAAGETFADVRTGLRAQVQHLKAYASTDGLNNACVDKRFQYVSRGTARYVEWLAIPQNPYGKGWAADADYGTKLLRIMDSL
ncbi:N-acetylmuramoyl-L-alanine amidase [Roseburia sp. AM23-20]|uniref:N-acetylmuramoyl-L-alanine amidase n=1 Tax=Roseburia sp. AM23-20 TaxID=2292066 RepID=UPI000E549B97|nr:N-acetylmuramoyl-L-alanine amidase [Roseburia sp. AM23-20]RHF95768.1 N-acetylmuramoyl-L-alanine amidase [Roseburia sp. AM23-20]